MNPCGNIGPFGQKRLVPVGPGTIVDEPMRKRQNSLKGIESKDRIRTMTKEELRKRQNSLKGIERGNHAAVGIRIPAGGNARIP